ncbi:DUF6082 family protein [Streptomyces chartreusis]|uniref:Secreted protein n=1 Tax=Streptomyces chartreusis TaxID=1969 RepID=A0A7H8T7P3_STRCX|nr:DUF6082 family protein [Streptomyces chartreusis]QKZ19501.1 hypothetical protein HUT05_20300 [Streptomyces chartreusis]
MATQTPAARPSRIGSAVMAGLGFLRAPLGRGRRRRQEELLLELLRQLALMTEEMRRANLIQQYRLTVEQLDRAIDDPSLAMAMSTLTGLSERQRRQMLFANRQYGVLLMAHRVGVYDWDELVGHLRVLCRNEIFAAYWASTVEHRRSVPSESLESRVGLVVDAMLDDLRDDPDEWWVIGPDLEGE